MASMPVAKSPYAANSAKPAGRLGPMTPGRIRRVHGKTLLRPNSSAAYWRRVFFSVGGLVAATTCSFFHHRCEYGMVPPSRHSDKTTPDKTTQLQKKYCIENSLSFTTTNNIAYFRSEVAYYRQLFCSFVFPSSRISAMDLLLPPRLVIIVMTNRFHSDQAGRIFLSSPHGARRRSL
jgi:hypothetical protein